AAPGAPPPDPSSKPRAAIVGRQPPPLPTRAKPAAPQAKEKDKEKELEKPPPSKRDPLDAGPPRSQQGAGEKRHDSAKTAVAALAAIEQSRDAPEAPAPAAPPPERPPERRPSDRPSLAP